MDCVCDCEKATHYYVASAGCADDEAAVAALPDQWVPKHSGPILANYLKNREQDHNNIVQDIANEAKVINYDLDSKIRALSEALLAHIKLNNSQIECLVAKCNPGEGVLTKEGRDIALREIYQLHSQRIDEMTNFNREAPILERERAEKLKVLLRDQFQRLIDVGHVTPRDLIHDFDERIYEINQQLLSNIGAYVELEVQLRVQAEESVAHARSQINEFCLEKVTKNRATSAMACASVDRTPKLRSTTALAEKKSDTSMTSVASRSRAHIAVPEAETLEACVLRLVQAYKAAVLRVFNDFSDRLCDLERDLGANLFITNLDKHLCQGLEFNRFIDKIIYRLSTSIHKKQMATRELLDATADDMLSMQKSLRSLGESLQDTFNVLHDAGHLWDSHILRQALAQKLTIAAVEDLFTSNDTIQMSNEVAINVSLEILRGSSDYDKLQVEYENIMIMLDRIAEMYRQYSEIELGRLEEFMKLPTPLANTLMAEFQCFLDKHPRSSKISNITGNPSEQNYASPIAKSGNLQSPFSRAILQTELQQLALRNWRNGFLESFESNVSLVPEELARQARLWVEERATALHTRYSLKMVSHSIRLERVKAARDSRFSELRQHEDRLFSHLTASQKLMDSLMYDSANFPPSASTLYPLNQWIDPLEKKIDELIEAKDTVSPETVRLKMCSYTPRLAKHRKLYEESIDSAIEAYKKAVENQIQNARFSGVRFMAQIRLFSDGGSYSSQEAIRMCNALVKNAESLDVCVNRAMEALQNRRHNLLSLADSQLQPLMKKCEDVSGRGAKAKPAPKKK